MKQIHLESDHALNQSLFGSLFGMVVGASAVLMLALMTGRSFDRSLMLIAAGALLVGGVIFVILYLHLLGQDK